MSIFDSTSNQHTSAPWPELGEDGELISPTCQKTMQPSFEVISSDHSGEMVHSVSMSQWDYDRARVCVNFCADLSFVQGGLITSPEVSQPGNKTVYCIALEGEQVTGSLWYHHKSGRDSIIGATGAEFDVPFILDVPEIATHDEITDLVDQAAWNKTYLAVGVTS
ncbi:MAG: hypothetical protein Q8K22_11140 [Rhodoferax sp.]|nr:hypothetical protein [Rhodoferax sp.]